MSKSSGVKRRTDNSAAAAAPSKKVKFDSAPAKKKQTAKHAIVHSESSDEIESDLESADAAEFDSDDVSGDDVEEGSPKNKQAANESKKSRGSQGHPESTKQHDGKTQKDSFLKEGMSSKEAHAEQKRLAQQRKAAKPHADSLHRSKKLWEKLRIKSSVSKEERAKLVEELFGIVTGRVKDFVFKHDSVRVVQCALKYATSQQKKGIARELRGSYKELAESKYAKFLVAKIVMIGNEERDWVVGEFCGHVKRLIRHPEAGWIMDDIYRGIATKEQKARLLREWYGPGFVIMNVEGPVTADLSKILEDHPAKRGPIMAHLKEMTNQLVQKKSTGFTMLHDALLQYFVNCKLGSPEHTEFLDMLKDDDDGDLFKNLAFTKDGSRLVCLALAHGNAKDRRTILKCFKTHIKALAGDVHGYHVLLAAYEVIDDTVMTAKAIFPELLNRDMEQKAKEQELLAQATHRTARIPLLWPMSPDPPKWLIPDAEALMLTELREIRKETSKKDPEKRRTELVEAMSQPLLDLIASQAVSLAGSSFGCQFITEILFGASGEKRSAIEAVARLVDDENVRLDDAYVGRMLKSLVQGGTFDKATNSIILVDPPLDFDNLLYQQIVAKDQEAIVGWATGSNPFTVLAMLESSTFKHRDELTATLKAHASELDAGKPGGRMILEKIGQNPAGDTGTEKAAKKKKKRPSNVLQFPTLKKFTAPATHTTPVERVSFVALMQESQSMNDEKAQEYLAKRRAKDESLNSKRSSGLGVGMAGADWVYSVGGAASVTANDGEYDRK
ncbi:hypothetical protein DV736_g4112, partial [Chaetothyriales sp. CBS 134916]